MPISRSGKQNSDPGPSGFWPQALLVLVVLGLAIWWFSPGEKDVPAPTPAIKKVKEADGKDGKKANEAVKGDPLVSPPQPSSALSSGPPRAVVSLPSGVPYIPSPMEVLEKKSQENLKAFGEKIHLEMPFVPGMQFIPYDFEEGVAALYGRDPVLDIDLSVFAQRGVLTPEQVLGYLKENSSSLPGLSKVSDLQIGEASTLNAPSGSGLAPLKVWQVEVPGRSLRLALANRSDGKGSYVFLVNAQPGVLENGDEHFAKYYEKLRALGGAN